MRGSDGYLIEVPYMERNGRGRFWKHEGGGYCNSVVTAGVFDLERAEGLCRAIDYDLKAVPDPLGRAPVTREEAEAYCAAKHYNGPFRVYGRCTEGELERLINAVTRWS